MLLARRNRTDATACLIRHTTINKLATGGDRSIEVHLNSIKVQNPNLIKDKRILLIDDVTTTHNSLFACKQLLLEAGAAQVYCLALGQTV
jgi:predicted amidophosphoribosyltransferase